MLRIEYNGTFLKLAPGSSVQMEKNSPVFALDNAFSEYSSPVTIVYCEENVQALGIAFFEYGTRKIQRIDVNVFDKETFRCRAKLVINKNVTNTSNRGKSNLQGFLLTGASRFFNQLKNIKLKDLELGGRRSFSFTTWDPFDSSNGFWQHVHATWDNSYDYVVIPCRNEEWTANRLRLTNDWMSYMGRGEWPDSGVTEAFGEFPQFSPIVPFPKVKYILNQVFKENGWKLDTTGLNDIDWENLIMLNIVEVPYFNPIGGFVWPSTDIYVSKMMSPEITCTQFVLSLCKRYGWMPIFTDNNECFLYALKETNTGTVKDFTAYAGSVLEDDYLETAKVFAFKNNINNNDSLPSSPDLSGYKQANPVYRKEDLPTPSGAFDLQIIFCYKDNCWYKIDLEELTNDRIWVRLADNIYDADADNATDTYETDASTMPMFLTKYRYDIATDTYYYGYFPACKISFTKEWGIRLLMYHGLVDELKEDGTAGSLQYPYASCTNVLPISTALAPVTQGAWSNVYHHKNINGTDIGIVEYWFGKFIKASTASSTRLINFYLPLHELISLKWNDLILLRNELFLLQKYVEPIPYKGYIQATLNPINLGNSVGGSGGGVAGVYVRLTIEDISTGGYVSIPDSFFGGSSEYTNLTTARVVARFYSDLAGTVPLTVSALTLLSSQSVTVDGAAYLTIPSSQVVGATTPTDNVDLLELNPWQLEYDFTSTSGSPFIGPIGHYLVTPVLVASADYIIIP